MSSCFYICRRSVAIAHWWRNWGSMECPSLPQIWHRIQGSLTSYAAPFASVHCKVPVVLVTSHQCFKEYYCYYYYRSIFLSLEKMLKERKQQLRKYLCCGPQGSGLGRKLVSTELPSLALTQGWGVRWTLLSEQQEGGRRRTKPTQCLETLQGREEWLYN